VERVAYIELGQTCPAKPVRAPERGTGLKPSVGCAGGRLRAPPAPVGSWFAARAGDSGCRLMQL